MTFEEWGKTRYVHTESAENMYADWKADREKLLERMAEMKEQQKAAFKQGWDDALECFEAEKGIDGYPVKAQFENCWYAFECDHPAPSKKED